jgi:hypothetical protein
LAGPDQLVDRGTITSFDELALVPKQTRMLQHVPSNSEDKLRFGTRPTSPLKGYIPQRNIPQRKFMRRLIRIINFIYNLDRQTKLILFITFCVIIL